MYKAGYLNSLGNKHNTDKSNEYILENVLTQGHDYLKNYELFLKEFINDEFTLVELGCDKGESLRMWREYYPKAEIIGIDIKPEVEKILEPDNIKFICENAASDDLPQKISETATKDIKIIIDDCSHAWGDQRYSFEKLFPILSSGGYYIIEDMECGTMGAYPDYPPRFQDSQPFLEYIFDRMRILRVSERRNPVQFRPYFNELPKHIQEIELSIDMATLIHGAIIFRKK